VRYPCKFLLIAAADPCKCGYLADASRACARVPACGEDYLGRISGPLLDRFDLRVDVPPVSFQDLELTEDGDASVVVAARVATAREVQRARYADRRGITVNADASGRLLDEVAQPDEEGRALLRKAAERVGLSARGYHRVLRVARTIADLGGREQVARSDIAEAISFRMPGAAG
jgi:magnesium chelatase family protein